MHGHWINYLSSHHNPIIMIICVFHPTLRTFFPLFSLHVFVLTILKLNIYRRKLCAQNAANQIFTIMKLEISRHSLAIFTRDSFSPCQTPVSPSPPPPPPCSPGSRSPSSPRSAASCPPPPPRRGASPSWGPAEVKILRNPEKYLVY